MRWEYNNVRIAKGYEWKAAFQTYVGIYKPTVMFFGLKGSLTTFQRMMDQIFRKEISEGWLFIYMDNILIGAYNKEDLKRKTQQVLDILLKHNLYCKQEKC